MSKFRIVIFTSASPLSLDHFLWRLERDLPEFEIAVLYEARSSALSWSKRMKRGLRLVRERDFRAFVRHRLWRSVTNHFEQSVDAVLRIIHAAPNHPNGVPSSLDDIIERSRAKGIQFHRTADIHDSASVNFVENIAPDLGVIYGTRILKPHLFSIPRRGSINIHKHKLPDYRGAGDAGIWELRDNRTEATVSVHRVLKEVDAGSILDEMSFPIAQFDTLESLSLKASLLAIDLLIDVLKKEHLGQTVETPQGKSGTLYKGLQAHQIFAIERQIRAARSVFKPAYSRPFVKLLVRTAMLPAVSLRNRRQRARKVFPVLILFHHLVTDRAKRMGLPTAQFAAHIRFLKKHYKIASLPEAIQLLERGEVAEPTVVLTFDDGYGENFLCLRAVAERERVPITLFVCTQHVSEGKPFQHDLDKNEAGFVPLRWDQIRYFDQHGVVIGSHTRNHFDCGNTDEATLKYEIVGSRDDLHEQLGPKQVQYFAFPKGHPTNMSRRAREIANQTYDFVFSACGGVNRADSFNTAEIYRFGHPESLWELELLLQGLLEFRKISSSRKLENTDWVDVQSY